MKKRIFAVMLAASVISATQASAHVFESPLETPELSDLFNNNLFEVVAEVNMPEGLSFNSDYDLISWNDETRTFTLYKDFQVNIGDDGNVSVDLSKYKESGSMYNVEEVDGEWINVPREKVFNDGLIYSLESLDDGFFFWEEQYYKDVNGNTVYELELQGPEIGVYYSMDYNLGLITDMEKVDGDNANTYYTAFVQAMTDNTAYIFDGKASAFNDDGYALFQANSEDGNGKWYVLKLKKGIIPTVYYNGSKIKFDQIPVIEDGRTLVPLRAIFETLGAEVDWNGDTQTVTAKKDDTEISLIINNTTASKNGESISLDVPAKIINGRTLVPVRFVADCFGVGVDWDGDMQRVLLTSD